MAAEAHICRTTVQHVSPSIIAPSELRPFTAIISKTELTLPLECCGLVSELLLLLFSLAYLKSVAGYRTVPVELGSRYTAEEWSQKLMTVADFIDNHVTKVSAVSVGAVLPYMVGSRWVQCYYIWWGYVSPRWVQCYYI